MHYKIINQTPQLLIVALNSGRSVHLAPNETSQPLMHAEINGNKKVEKLLASGGITLVQEEMQGAAPLVQPEPRRRPTEPAGEEEHKGEGEHEREREPKREDRKE